MPVEGTYRRGQVEWALWRYFRQLPTEHRRPPPVFRTRVKRLLELDSRGNPFDDGSETSFAFFDETPGGTGADVAYTAFNGFCLALGLDLLDTGFKQSEVVFLLRHLRPLLEQAFPKILKCPPSYRGAIAASDRPRCPTYERNGSLYADCRVFLVVNKVEITEVFSYPEESRAKGIPLILTPNICEGIAGLETELHKMNHSYRKALIVELAHAAAMVSEQLEQAPLVRRGPK